MAAVPLAQHSNLRVVDSGDVLSRRVVHCVYEVGEASSAIWAVVSSWSMVMYQPVRIAAGCCGFCVPVPWSIRCCNRNSSNRPSSTKVGWSVEHGSRDRRTLLSRHPARNHEVLVGRIRKHPASLQVDLVPTSIASDLKLKIRNQSILIHACRLS